MTSVAEAADSKTELAGGLAAGVNTLSLNQAITFTPYDRYVLPIDGTVYWIKSGPTKEFTGSLHYATATRQNEDETVSVNSVVFTSLSEVNDLNRVSPTTIYIGEFQGQKFAFSNRRSFYKQADIYHYNGDAVYPALADVLVADPLDLNERLVVSNSLPVWLTLGGEIPVYPSFLVDANIAPPYIAVQIAPENTNAIQAFPRRIPVFATTEYVSPDYWGDDYTDSPIVLPLSVPETIHSQLMRDKVKITSYGLRNDEVLAYLDNVLDYSLNTDIIGVCNMPAVRDEKRVQTELGVLAIKKSIEFEVSYYQSRVYDVAVQFIHSATVNIYQE